MKKLLPSILFVASLITQSYAIEIPAEKEPEQINPDVYKFKDWEITQFKDMVIYKTNGMAVHGHKFGWVKKAGHCDEEFMYLTFSSMHKDKALLEKIIKRDIPIEVVFPQMEPQQPAQLEVFLVAVNDLTIDNIDTGMKVATFSGANNNQLFDAFLEHYNMIEIEIKGVYKSLFDIPLDSWSLDGYIASKAKAKEMCEAMIEEDKLI